MLGIREKRRIGWNRFRSLGRRGSGVQISPLEWAEFQRTVRLKFELRHDETPEDKILKLNPDTLLFEVQNDEPSQIGLVVGAIRDLGPSDADRVGEFCNRTPMGPRMAQSGG